MKNSNHIDRRIINSKKAIANSFLSLFKDKDINQITVSEICRLADINRGTFYKYYLDIYDLADSMSKEILSNLREILTFDVTIDSFRESLIKLLEFITIHRDHILEINKAGNRVSDLTNSIQKIFNDKLETVANILFPELDMQTSLTKVGFMASGCTGAVTMWLYSNKEIDTQKEVDIIIDCIKKLAK